MKKPESYLRRMLGDDAVQVTIRGVTYSLDDAVSIPDGDLEETLYEHPTRVLAWRRVLGKCREAYHLENDRYEELRRARFIQYWRVLEDQEREEMKKHLHDEDAPADPFKRNSFVKKRLALGVAHHGRGRWRKNFTDDLVWGWVHNDDEVLATRKRVRKLKREMDTAESVVESLEHRMRCISHLCARSRT